MNTRIESVDILRGLTIVAMIVVNTPGSWGHVYTPLLHADWHGLTPTDLIFPFFLFVVGISIYFAYKNKTETKDIYQKIVIRSLKLIGLGVFLNLFIPYVPFFNNFESFRIPGVLQRIGIVFFFMTILYINVNLKTLAGIGIVILLGYWLFLGFIPFQDGQLPTFDRAPNNWGNYIDLNLLGNHMWQPDYDPEGVISTLPSIVTCISGLLIGRQLDTLKDVKLLFMSALGFLVLGYILNIWFPINKALWSSSFVLVTSGYATLLLAVIYYLRDLKQIKFGSIFKYSGMNAITIYFLSSFISKTMYLTTVGYQSNLHSYIYETVFVHSFYPAKLASLMYAVVVVLFYLGLGYVLYKNKIIIKV